MSRRDATVLIRDMIASCERIGRYIDGYDFLRFRNDDRTVDAVCRCLEILGEASKSVGDHPRRHDPSIPWQEIAALRNRIIHSYFSVDLNVVWTIASDEVPNLLTRLMTLLAVLEGTPR